MLNHIPFEIQVEIMKWLPVKSLIQFRSVSKAWRSMIDASEFIADHRLRHTQPQHLVVRYRNPSETENIHVSFVDDNTFPQQKFALTVPRSVRLLHSTMIFGSSHGLLCFYGYFDEPGDSLGLTMGFAVIWNPSIRKSLLIAVPYFYNEDVEIVLGFGVCPVTSEPKIVMIKQISNWWNEDATRLEIKVYTMNSGKWRSLSSNLPPNSISVEWSQVVIDRFIYLLGYDTAVTGAGRRLILSFDMTDESFRVIDLPDSMPQMIPSISKLRESLTVLEYSNNINTGNQICCVWMMEHSDGVQISFTKLFTMETPHALIRTLGFRENGEVLMETSDGYDYDPFIVCWSSFVSYQPNSKSINVLGIHAKYVVRCGILCGNATFA